jgi:hypothetical protein
MPTVTDLCNLALARLGESATITDIAPPDGSVQAEHCAMFYPVARDAVLELMRPRFAIRRATLALLDRDAHGWQYCYAAPAGLLSVLALLPASAKSGAATQPFIRESDEDGTPLILADTEGAALSYVGREEDPGKFSPLFTDALAWRLASDLAGPLLKGDAGAAQAKSCYQSFLYVLGVGRQNEANQQRSTPEHVVPWIGGR